MERPHQESWSYRMAIRLFDSAFAACDHLPPEEQQSLVREIGARLLQRIPKPDVAAEASQPVTIRGVSIKVEEGGRADASNANPGP